MSDDKGQSKLQGVGGWLGFLVFILAILSPARMLFQTTANIRETAIMGQVLGPNTSTYIPFTWALVAASVIGSIFLAYRLLAIHRWSSVRIVVIGLWCLASIPTLIDAVVGSILFPEFGGPIVSEALWAAAKSSISATIWTAYLLKSKRVANTYIKDQDETQRIFG
ncbi:DUF2569 family protein [Sphingopyxis sp. 2PD]|uniref:DUF2569 family protein n=1 Tax=Sphingopyxis sp. 2PD TaxID=2502196 RepID=UPI0010F7195F|nr:DUF2569 family protein [Sphingopyxis sp. 2PD]